MRSQIFRVGPVLVNDTDVVVLVKDMDGATPFDLFIENVDVRAKLRTRYGSKNANVQFEAVDAGAAGNAVEVVIGDVSDSPASQAFDVSVASTTITITLATDAAGQPTLTADQVAAGVNADAGASALVRVTRAPGSDGSAVLGLVRDTDPVLLGADIDQFLAGGFDAMDLGDVDVFVSPTGAPDFSGPWVELADTTFDNLAASVTKKLAFTEPVRGLMVTATAGGYDTEITLTAVAWKKGL